MLTGTAIVTGLGLAISLMLVGALRWLPQHAGEGSEVADEVERLLPRIQCAQCGYPGCRPYAEAIAAGAAAINRCPPGGEATVRRLAALLGQPTQTVDTSLGSASLERVARIEEARCIGCNLCARACPVDAIAGIAQMMHTVITKHCTGCELCLPPCPVDCISLVARHA